MCRKKNWNHSEKITRVIKGNRLLADSHCDLKIYIVLSFRYIASSRATRKLHTGSFWDVHFNELQRTLQSSLNEEDSISFIHFEFRLMNNVQVLV